MDLSDDERLSLFMSKFGRRPIQRKLRCSESSFVHCLRRKERKSNPSHRMSLKALTKRGAAQHRAAQLCPHT